VNDHLNGDEQFGVQLEGEQKKSFGISFDQYEFVDMKVESVDKTYVREYTKDQLVGKMKQDQLLNDHERLKKVGGANVYISY